MKATGSDTKPSGLSLQHKIQVIIRALLFVCLRTVDTWSDEGLDLAHGSELKALSVESVSQRFPLRWCIVHISLVINQLYL